VLGSDPGARSRGSYKRIMQLLLPLDSKESADVVDTDQLDGEEQVAK
jgi:hypothetical protein